jgi:trans-aconitate 2-methyltransferase
VAFVTADVVADPLPGAPDLVFARFLVTHLADPAAAIARWAARLAPGGRILLEDTDRIDTDLPAFREYLDRVAERLEAGGHRLEAGPLLAGLAAHSRVAELSPPAADAAAMFRLNLDAWCDDEAVRRRLGAALDALADDRRTGVITWTLRQAVVTDQHR